MLVGDARCIAIACFLRFFSLGAFMKTILGLAVLAFLITEPAHADATTKDTLALYNNPVGRAFLAGMTEGMKWTNAGIEARTGQALYCTPPAIAITVEQHVSILRDFLAKHPEHWKSPIGST